MPLRETGYVDPIAADEVAHAALEIDWADVCSLYPQQFDFCCGSSAHLQGLIAGRGTGKSHVLFGAKALFLALLNPGTYLPGGRVRFCPGVMLARTMDEMIKVGDGYWLETLRRWKDATGIDLLAWYSSKHDCYTLVNGARVYQDSYGREDSLRKVRSNTYAWALMDELMFAEVDSQRALMVTEGTLRHQPCNERQLAFATSPDGQRGAVAYAIERWLQDDPDVYLQTATVFDNPFIDDAYRTALRKGCTDRQWAAEGEGKVLRPLRSVYVEYNPATHVIPWRWDPRLPWVLMVDWGTSWGWAGVAQVVDRDRYVARDGRELANGTWVVCREYLMEDGNAPQLRREITKLVRELGYPHTACADRAVPTENQWLMGQVGDNCHVRTLVKKDEIRRAWGIGAVSYMLAPGEGKPPRLYFASSLRASVDAKAGTIRSAMESYSYRQVRLDTGEKVVTNDPERNTPPTHAVDGLRYGISCTAYDHRLHGGDVLPYVQTIAHQERAESTTREDRLRRKPRHR
jgi:hypothetical protein